MLHPVGFSPPSLCSPCLFFSHFSWQISFQFAHSFCFFFFFFRGFCLDTNLTNAKGDAKLHAAGCQRATILSIPYTSPPSPLLLLPLPFATCAQTLRLKSMWKMLSLVNFLACDAVQQLLGKSRRRERVGGSGGQLHINLCAACHDVAHGCNCCSCSIGGSWR